MYVYLITNNEVNSSRCEHPALDTPGCCKGACSHPVDRVEQARTIYSRTTLLRWRMTDPLDQVKQPQLKEQLLRYRSWYGEVHTSSELRDSVQGFQGEKGIYKPAGERHALWVRQTLRGVYPDKEPEEHPDGSWTYRYAPEGRGGEPAMDLDTNRSLLQCMRDHVPVGVFRQRPDLGAKAGYEALGLAFVESYDEDGKCFVLRGEPIDWTQPPTPQSVVPTFEPFEFGDAETSEVSRIVRDQRFGVTIRRLYHERCSLCEVGYRLKGRSLALEAAHIIPVESKGRIGDLRNGILLCRNHHTLFDSYAWTFDEKFRVLVADDKDFRKSAAANHVLKFESQRLANLPDFASDLPGEAAIRWRMGAFEKAA
jgi:hypothetical protein